MNMYNWHHYNYDTQYVCQHYNAKLQELERNIQEMERRVQQLEKGMQENKKNSVERIEYHFDQLKIEHLHGKLHIGLSPEELSNMEDFNGMTTNGTMCESSISPFKQKIATDLSEFLNTEGLNMIRNFSEQYNHPVDEAYETHLIDDMEKQLLQRIDFYEEKAKGKPDIKNEEQLAHFIREQIKKEIYQSLERYMKSQNKKGE